MLRFRLRRHSRVFLWQFIKPDAAVLQENMVESEGKRFQGLFPDGRFQFAFPYHDRVPAHFSQFVHYLKIPFLIALDFIQPEPGIRFRHNVVFASFMSVPEASVHEDAGAVFTQHDVWFSWQAWMVEPVSESMRPQEFPDKDFRLGVLAPYCRHIVVTLLYGQTVRHL